MNYVLITHAVHDYNAWKRVFDDAAAIRKAAGEIQYHLLRDESDANKVFHFSRWTTLHGARRFFESAELVEIRRLAGVEAPSFAYLNSLEQGLL